MDYNDNDYEGQNLRLGGEESSKISSVLPFALPKFDFDDSLHGHLRFDSLVENEVFLGIPSQEDNHWIEDFSRGGNCIEFSSSATESCALPRHINVWSEATSSESVEMLLKAVGQEEMVPGENTNKESDPGHQLDSSMRQMEDDKIDVGGNENPSLPAAEVGGSFSRSNQNAGVEGVHNEQTLPAQEINASIYGDCVDSKDSGFIVTTEDSNIDTKRTNDNQGETCDVLSESLPNRVEDNLPDLGMKIDSAESSSQKIAVSVGVSVNQDKIRNFSFVSSGFIAKGVSDSVEEQGKRFNKIDGSESRIAVESDNMERHCSSEISSKKSSEEEHAVEMCITNFEEASSMHEKGESVSRGDVCKEVASVVEPLGGSQQGITSDTEIKQLAEGHNKVLEKSSIPLHGEGIGGLGLKDIVTPRIDGSTELKQVPVIQPPHQHESFVGNEDICPEDNRSVEAPLVTLESSTLHEVPVNATDKDGQSTTNNADGPSNATGSTFSGECFGEKSVTDDITDTRDTGVIQNENVKVADHIPSSSIVRSIQVGTEEDITVQAGDHECSLDGSAYEKEDNKPHGPSDTVFDDIEKEVGPTFLGDGVEAETTTQSQPNSSPGDHPVLNTEDENTKLTSRVEGDDMVGCPQPSRDTGYRDQTRETECEAPVKPSTSVSKECLESKELALAIETEKGLLLDSVAGVTKTSDESVSLAETSSVAISGEAFKVVNKKLQHSDKDVMVQGDGAKAAPTEKPMEAETERNSGTNSSTVSVTANSVETDKSNQAAAGSSSTDLSESKITKEANIRSTEEGTFTFDIRPLRGQSSEDSGKVLQSFPRIQACKLSLAGDGSPSTSGSSQKGAVVVKETSHTSSLIPAVTPPPGDVSSPSERKARRGSTKSGKASAKKGNQVKEGTPLRLIDKGEKSSQFLSPLGAGQLMTFDTVMKPRGSVPPIPTCSLPDLNTSAPSSAFFQQPFTDLQQVQLRAQIFVYGSLIQGAAPDEACMVSAFDGGRSVWEPSWRACVERLHGQKSQGNNNETPVPSRSGAKAPDQTNRQGFPQSEVLSSMAGRASSKAIASSVVNPMIPLSSPLWSISTPSGEVLPPSSTARSTVFDYQAATAPLNPYQTPPIRNYMAHTTWTSQASFPVPWLAPSQSSPTNYPAFPITEPVKLNPVKESLLPISSGTKHASPTSATYTGAPTVFAGPSSLDLKKTKVSTGQTVDTKARKRKKSSGAEDVVQISVTASPADAVSASLVANQSSKKAPAVGDLSQISLVGRNQTDSTRTPVVSSHYSTSVSVAAPSSFVPKGTAGQFISMASPPVSNDQLKRGDLSMDKRALNIEGFSKVEEAKLQAQEAAAHAAAAISHCEGVWSQLNQQKNSGLGSDAESKLASAAAAIAAAACVAKAAAAAAKIASNAAVQAKQMADEAVAQCGTVDSILVSDSISNLANVSPVSIFKGGDRNNLPSFAISAAREAARKRIEAASAATRHAENLDAIVKAAELAAEAVSHAGKIVAMGDPFSLSELAEAGPNNYWKVSQFATEHVSKPNDMNKNKSVSSNAGEVPSVHMNQQGPEKDMHITSHVLSSTQGDAFRNMVDDHAPVEDSLIAPVKHGENSFKPHKDKKVSDSGKTVGVVSDPNVESRSNLFSMASIKEGTRVEVLKDHGDSKKAWFSASVLSLKDGEALVCYTELQSDEGSEAPKEWVSLEAKDGDAPKVRIPHPMTAVQFEGTRKRRRAAVKDYTWSVGDKVDAWVQDCWREGIIAEKNKKDATSLSVHFPAQGETLMVKVWHLRPTLIWSDDQWTEWCRPGQDGTSQGDTPAEKRPKLGATSFETTNGKGKMAKNIDFAEIGTNEEPRLPLSANEKVFSIGSTREENKPNTVRAMRSALEREGSRVIFGVPKPGKKRKFMEVSKHYVSDGSTKTNVPNDSVKLAKYLVPQGSGSRGFKNNSKLDLKEKPVAESKPRALKSGKPPSIPSRTLARKDDSTASRPNLRDPATSDNSVKGSTSNDGNESSEQNLAEVGSFSNVEETSRGNMVFTSQALPQENRKKVGTRKTKSERVNQGKLAPASGKLAKSEANEKLISEVAEPRRSNRRIQPTSRLLEGLQSSLIISKIPSSSHDKSHRSHNKGTTRGNNNRG